jgi:hypothetical protein
MFTPPAPYQAVAPAGTFWYGSTALWTQLPVSGMWHATNGAYVSKLILWREGYNWKAPHNPPLMFTGRRIDGDAPSISAIGGPVFVSGRVPQAMMVAIDVPTTGCWEFSAYFGDTSLTFFILVQS